MENVEEIIKSLEEELACHQKLLGLAQRQKEEAQRGNIEGIIGILNERNQIIKKVKELTTFSSSMLKQPPRREDLPKNLASQIDGLLTRIKEAIEKLLKIDDEVRKILTEKRTAVKINLKKLSRGRKLLAGYHSRRPRPSKFIDTKK